MSLEADLVVDRLRLKRRLAVWRAIAVGVFVAALLLAVASHRPFATGPYVARLEVKGIIADDPDRLTLIDRARDDPRVKALILAIDSPGGSVAGGEALHDAIARLAAVKPVVTVMGGLAASAGYMIAVPSARIFASNATVTGSIGVIMQSPDISGLLDRVGVGVDELVSGPLKGQPSVVKPLSSEGRAMLQDLVMDLYGQFVDMVAQGRHMDPARVRVLADGRPYTGHKAIGLGLVDQIGTLSDARAWLADKRQVPANLPLRELTQHREGSWLHRETDSIVRNVVFSALIRLGLETGAKTLIPQGLVLDGPLALWQP